MLLIIQFPISDSRRFVDADTQCLGYPVWPIPEPDKDFVRHFGIIKKRWRGGLSGWVSENYVCEADRALRFKNPLRYTYNNPGKWSGETHLNFGVAYRRFYFDGEAVSKFEIGMWFDNWDKMTSNEVESLFQYFLKIPVIIPNPKGTPIECPLYQAGKYLASLFLLSSSRTQNMELHEFPHWWVQACEPIMFLMQDTDSKGFPIPFFGKSVSLQSDFSAELAHYFIPLYGHRFRLWNLRENTYSWFSYRENWNFRRPKHYETKAKSQVRELRIFLLRLHAEKECLKQILRNINQKKIVVTYGKEASVNLQNYLNIAIKRIARLKSLGEKVLESDIGELARESEDFVLPGEIDSIVTTLENLNIRRNILQKVEKHLRTEAMVIMGNQFNVQQAGVVGPNAYTENMTVNQIWDQASSKINLPQLAAELTTLRLEMLKQAKEPEHYVEVGTIASAETSAMQGNGSKALEYLSKTGSWALDIATKIGIGIATAAIKESMGIK